MKKKTVPGIYNYCDRWCERCHLSNLCALCDDPTSASFEKNASGTLNPLSLQFATPTTILNESTRDHGLSLTMAEVRNAWRRDEDQVQARKPHPLLIRSLDYDMRVFRWMASPDVAERCTTEEGSHLAKIPDSITVIARYSPFIHIKLSRAIASIITTDEWAEKNGLQKDSDGSAKIALIAIDRSVQAWHTLYNAMDSFEDDILSFLVTLQRLKEMVVQKFPNAMQFVRPGFDVSPDRLP